MITAAITLITLMVVGASAEENCVSFGRCGFLMNDETGHLENVTRCEKDYELMPNCTCVYRKGSGCRFGSNFINMGTVKNVYNCLKPITRCQRGKRCGYMYYGNLKMGQVECAEGYVLNGSCGCEKRGKKEGDDERCKFYKTPVNMYAGDNSSIRVEMVDCSLLMDTVDLPEGLELDWKLTPEESELVMAYSVVNEMNTYFSDNFVYIFGECGNGEWQLNFGGGRKVRGRVKRASRWSAEGNLRINSECNGNGGEAGRVSVNSIRKAATERCKKGLSSMKQKMRRECDSKMKEIKREVEAAKREKRECEEKAREVETALERVKKELEEKKQNVTKQQELVNRIKGNVAKMFDEFEALKQLIGKLENACTRGADEFPNYEGAYDEDITSEEEEEGGGGEGTGGEDGGDEAEELFEYESK